MNNFASMRKAELIEEIEKKNKELEELNQEFKKLEKYKIYEDMANELGAMRIAIINSGFSVEKAEEYVGELLKHSIQLDIARLRRG